MMRSAKVWSTSLASCSSCLDLTEVFFCGTDVEHWANWNARRHSDVKIQGGWNRHRWLLHSLSPAGCVNVELSRQCFQTTVFFGARVCIPTWHLLFQLSSTWCLVTGWKLGTSDSKFRGSWWSKRATATGSTWWGYIVAKLFTSIFELAVDTTLQCFLCCEARAIEIKIRFLWCTLYTIMTSLSYCWLHQLIW